MYKSPPPILEPCNISKQWLESVLTAKHNCPVHIKSWDLVLPKERMGFLSEICFVDFECETIISEESNSSVGICANHLVLKFVPKDKKEKEFVCSGHLFDREIMFYKFAISENVSNICKCFNMTLSIPDVYYADIKETYFTLVMNNLKYLRYKTIVSKDGLGLENTKVALSSIAQIHAIGLIYISKYGDPPLESDINTDFIDLYLIPNLKSLADRFCGTSISSTIQALIPLTKEMRIAHFKNPFLKTLIHGDYWAGQIMFSENEKSVKILDWQFSCLGNPVCDLLTMIFMSCDPDIIFGHCFIDVITVYWKCFIKILEDSAISIKVTFNDLLENIEKNRIYGFVFLAASIEEFQVGDIISDDRIDSVIKLLQTKGVFKRFLNSNI